MFFLNFAGFFLLLLLASIISILEACHLHLAVNPLHLLSCCLLSVVDLDMDMPTSFRVVTWLAVVKGFLFTMQILLSSVDFQVFLHC